MVNERYNDGNQTKCQTAAEAAFNRRSPNAIEGLVSEINVGYSTENTKSRRYNIADWD